MLTKWKSIVNEIESLNYVRVPLRSVLNLLSFSYMNLVMPQLKPMEQ